MRNEALETRIIGDLRRDGVTVVASGPLAARYGSRSSVGKALGRLVRLEALERVRPGVYRVLSQEESPLAFDRAWSHPGGRLDPDRRIAVTLARPTFRDVVRLCRSYGVPRVRRVLRSLAESGDVSEELASEWQSRLDNVERGFGRAAPGLLAARDRTPA